MVKYFGDHPAKQFLKRKLVRFGYRNWVLSSSTRYHYVFDVYREQDNCERKVPLVTGAVLKLLSHVKVPRKYTVFFDNYFSIYPLLVTLLEL